MRELKSVADARRCVNASQMRGYECRLRHQFGAWLRRLIPQDVPMGSQLLGRSPIAERLLAWLGSRENEMAALLSELVSVPTENPPGRNYQACATVLERKLRDADL